MSRTLASVARIESAITRIRGQNVMLDGDLARLYGVPVKALNQAVRRNIARFPRDFMFTLTVGEAGMDRDLRSQTVTSKSARGGRRYPPLAFTEQGVAMLSSVLRSPKAIAVNIQIMRAFVQLRRLLESNADLADKLQELERKYDGQFKVVFNAIRVLMSQPSRPVRRIGFKTGT